MNKNKHKNEMQSQQLLIKLLIIISNYNNETKIQNTPYLTLVLTK